MENIVESIQVGGGRIVYSLEDACREYIRLVESDELFRSKISFEISVGNDRCKSITIRDEDNKTVAYGDFEGLESFLEYVERGPKARIIRAIERLQKEEQATRSCL